MMNKEKYKQVWSQIYPSDEAVERILDMTQNKKKRFKFKGIIIAAAVIAALFCGTLTANAATDGALFAGVHMILNGEKVNIVDYVKNYESYTDENGNEIVSFEVELPEDEENSSASIVIEGDAKASSDKNGVDSDVDYEVTNND